MDTAWSMRKKFNKCKKNVQKSYHFDLIPVCTKTFESQQLLLYLSRTLRGLLNSKDFLIWSISTCPDIKNSWKTLLTTPWSKTCAGLTTKTERDNKMNKRRMKKLTILSFQKEKKSLKLMNSSLRKSPVEGLEKTTLLKCRCWHQFQQMFQFGFEGEWKKFFLGPMIYYLILRFSLFSLNKFQRILLILSFI